MLLYSCILAGNGLGWVCPRLLQWSREQNRIGTALTSALPRCQLEFRTNEFRQIVRKKKRVYYQNGIQYPNTRKTVIFVFKLA